MSHTEQICSKYIKQTISAEFRSIDVFDLEFLLNTTWLNNDVQMHRTVLPLNITFINVQPSNTHAFDIHLSHEEKAFIHVIQKKEVAKYVI